MECKHEKGIRAEVHLTTLGSHVVGFICRGCGIIEEDVVILTKAQHQLMQDVISLASDLRMYYKEWVGMKFEGESGSIAYLEFIDKQNVARESYYNTRDMLDNALDELKE